MVFKPFRVGDETLGSDDRFNDSGALTALTTFNCVDKHYTYTLLQETNQLANEENINNESMCNDDIDECDEDKMSHGKNLETMPSFVQIR